MARRKRKKNPVGWGDGVGLAIGLLVLPPLTAMGALVASGGNLRKAIALGVAGNVVFGGAALLGAWSNGLKNPSISRGIVVGEAINTAWAVSAAALGAGTDARFGPAPAPSPFSNAVLFPDLRVGDRVLLRTVDVTNGVDVGVGETLPGIVDLILSDREFVSVAALSTDGSFSFRGSVPRRAIVRVLPPLINA